MLSIDFETNRILFFILQKERRDKIKLNWKLTLSPDPLMSTGIDVPGIPGGPGGPAGPGGPGGPRILSPAGPFIPRSPLSPLKPL